jgi:hypothetical protein
MASLMLAPTALAGSTAVPAPCARPTGSRCEVVSLAEHRAARRASSTPSWHFYRRRVAAVVVLVGVLVGVWQVVSALGAMLVVSPATQFGHSPDVAVVVHDAAPGETLWSLAVALGPDGDVRRSLDELTRLNGGSGLVAGRPVRVPATWYAADR